MCGIFGLLRLGGETQIDQRKFALALTTLRHRGPDAENVRRLDNDAIFGHTRLSIIDLRDENNQPLSILDRYWIVFNGEIYNYVELRKELQQLGVRFRTDGDTEVLLYAYALWGADCVAHFNGMWAFAIYDTHEKTLFCSRDRFGEKPFNYTVHKGHFLFASEIKAMLSYVPELAQPELNAIANYCRTSVGAQNTQSWFKNVHRLAPGHNLIIRNGQIRILRYWHYPTDTDHDCSFDSARERFGELFKDAVRLRMRSDVPLGITLSSGIDSSCIAYTMQDLDSKPHHCFTAGYRREDRSTTEQGIYKQHLDIDETKTARATANALGLIPHSIETSYTDFTSRLERITYFLESGHSSPATIPLMQLLEHARKHVTVILDGQGADELLGGYILSTIWPAVADLVARGRIQDALASVQHFSRAYSLSYATKMLVRYLSNDFEIISRAHHQFSGIDRLFAPEMEPYRRWKDYMDLPGEGDASCLGKLLLHQHAGGMINLLHYGDAISMANGMESRMPFLDYRLVEFAWRLPPSFKVDRSVSKHILREAMRKLVPDHILDQKRKIGFSTPISKEFREQPHMLDVLTERRCAERGVFDSRGVKAVVDDHRTGRRDRGPLLFRLLSTELWFRCFIDMPIGDFTATVPDQSDDPLLSGAAAQWDSPSL